jgi:hypothetical protein
MGSSTPRRRRGRSNVPRSDLVIPRQVTYSGTCHQ